jgi:hypothetical protein
MMEESFWLPSTSSLNSNSNGGVSPDAPSVAIESTE